MKAYLTPRRTAVLATALALVVSVGSFGDTVGGDPDWRAPPRAARKKNPIPADETSVAAGKVVYARECLSCHGPGGRGDGPAAKELKPKPNDLTDPKVWEQTDGALFWKITEGRKPMPSYDKLLTEAQRWQVVDYLHTLAPPKGGDQPK